MNQSSNISNIFFFLSLAFFIGLGYFLFLPFVKIFLLSAFIVIILYPLYKRLNSYIKSDILSSLILSALVLLFIIIPSILIITVFINEFMALYPEILKKISKAQSIEKIFLSLPFVSDIQKYITVNFNTQIDIQSLLKNILSFVSEFLMAESKAIFLNIAFLIFGIVLMLFTIFFLFKDGENFYKWIYKLIPLHEKEKNYIVNSSYQAIQGIVLGSFLTALAQGILSFIGYFFAGISFSLFWAIMTFFASFIPIGGASLVWVPIAIYLLFSKGIITAVLFSLWGTFVISTVDNIIKPIVIGEKANIHPAIMFFSILGGLNLFGFIGIFVAPIIVVILHNLLNIYMERYSIPN